VGVGRGIVSRFLLPTSAELSKTAVSRLAALNILPFRSPPDPSRQVFDSQGIETQGYRFDGGNVSRKYSPICILSAHFHTHLPNPIAALTDEIKHAPRILALDGGGVRGLSSLLILREIMLDIQDIVKSRHPPKPCDYFELIGGTSTGGLIALMLGLLGMVNHRNRSYLMR